MKREKGIHITPTFLNPLPIGVKGCPLLSKT